MIDYSIIIPVYFNQGALSITMQSILDEVINKNPNLCSEVIFVEDGSEDNSFQELCELHAKYPEYVKIIKLTRNFGQLSAILAGLTYACGKCSIFMSADNQDPASLVNDMLEAHFKDNYDIVICTRESRDESLFRTWTSKIFYMTIRKLSFPNMPAGGFDYVLLSRRVVKTLLRNREATGFLQAQILWTGYKTKLIGYHRRQRQIGKSRWTFAKKLTYLLDGVISYSFLPIRLMSAIGLIVAILGFLYAAIIFVTKLVWGLPIQGWAPIMIVLLVLGGLQMVMLGIIGEYLWRVLAETRDREPFVIDSVYGDFAPSVDLSQSVSNGRT
jgi:dolichol-phosphate mannosyltransferase